MPTKVFISWSGDLSRKLGEALRDWLPKALQSVKPYFSPNDIEKGTRWDSEVAGELGASDIGIICITPDNPERPWILFEAGALSKAVGKARVCPILFGGLKPTDLSGPLASFQLTQFEKEDFRKMVATINGALGDGRLSDGDLGEVFDTWWPKLDKSVSKVLRGHGQRTVPEPRDMRDMVEEILELVRSQSHDAESVGSRGLQELVVNVCNAAADTWGAFDDDALAGVPLDHFCTLWMNLRWLCQASGLPASYDSFLGWAERYGVRGRALASRLRQVEELEILLPFRSRLTIPGSQGEKTPEAPLDSPPKPE